jgi:hypothetical protein
MSGIPIKHPRADCCQAAILRVRRYVREVRPFEVDEFRVVHRRPNPTELAITSSRQARSVRSETVLCAVPNMSRMEVVVHHACEVPDRKEAAVCLPAPVTGTKKLSAISAF